MRPRRRRDRRPALPRTRPVPAATWSSPAPSTSGRPERRVHLPGGPRAAQDRSLDGAGFLGVGGLSGKKERAVDGPREPEDRPGGADPDIAVRPAREWIGSPVLREGRRDPT